MASERDAVGTETNAYGAKLPGPIYATDASGDITGLSGLGSDIGTSNALIIGGATRGTGKEIFQVSRIDTNADAVARPTNALFEHGINPAASGAVDFHNIDAFLYGGGSNANIGATTRLYCVEGKSTFTGTAGQTMGAAYGVFGTAINSGSSNTLTRGAGVLGHVQNTGAGVTTLGAAFYAATPTISAGSITTAHGLYVETISGGSGNNYSIFTNGGRVKFFGGTAIPAGGTNGVGIGFSTATDFGVYFGSGAPTLTAAKGSLYLRSDGSTTNDRAYINTNGGTTWTALTTVA